MLQDLRVKKLGIIYSHEDFGIAEQKLVTAACSAAGITVNAQSFETAAADFHQQVEATKGSEAIFVAAVGASVTSIIRQLREARFSGSVLTPPSGANPAFFVLPEMQGVMLVAPIIYNPAYLFAREAGDKFTARYQKPFDHWGASGYDFITLISGLLEDRAVSRQGVRDVLAAGFDYSGVFGPVRVRPGDHIIAFPMYPAQIVNNTLKFR
jgi:ABC-type branched-subunit amino acid transport system substrate-binding protein